MNDKKYDWLKYALYRNCLRENKATFFSDRALYGIPKAIFNVILEQYTITRWYGE